MSILGNKKSVTIEVLNGGYLVDWRDDSRGKRDLGGWTSNLPPPPTSGREVMTTKKAVNEFVKGFL